VSIIVADVVSTIAESFTGDRRGRRPTAHDYVVLMGTKSIFLAAMLGVPCSCIRPGSWPWGHRRPTNHRVLLASCSSWPTP
jgi:hypothetical protein